MIYDLYEQIYKNAVNYIMTIKPNYEISKLRKIINQQVIHDKVNFLMKKGLSVKQSIGLLENMPKILFMTEETLDSHLCFIYNSDVLYATLLLKTNSYEWCSYDFNKKQFLKSNNQEFNSKKIEVNEDSMIRTIFDSVFRKDIMKYAKIEENDDLETRVLKLKKLHTNSNGYRIK